MAECNNDTIPSQKAKLSGSNLTDLRMLGFLRDEFSEAQLAALDKTILESMSEEELVLWYEGGIGQEILDGLQEIKAYKAGTTNLVTRESESSA